MPGTRIDGITDNWYGRLRATDFFGVKSFNGNAIILL